MTHSHSWEVFSWFLPPSFLFEGENEKGTCDELKIGLRAADEVT